MTPPKGFFASAKSLISGWRGDLSSGHTSMIGSFIVAVVQEIRGAPIEHVALWLGAGLGGYGFAKGTEMVCSRQTVEVSASPAPMAPVVPDTAAENGGAK